MKKYDITFVTNNNLCFSCGVCRITCHVACIDFEITNAGRLQPKIDYSACTNCGVCFDVCPGFDKKLNVLNLIEQKDFYGESINSYLGRATDEFIYKNSQSGGMVTATLSYLFEQKLIKHVLTVKMDYAIEPTPKYFLATSIEELYQSQKSIYAPVNLPSSLNMIESLDGDIAVVGLPCHIEGILSLTKHNPQKYNKIKYKLGLICDGILSFNSIKWFSENITKQHKIIYKNKTQPNYLDANTTLEGSRKELIKIIPRKDRFILKNLTTPPRCHICFNKMNIHADLVFGDPWGLDGYDKENGASIIASRTIVGEDILKQMILTEKASLKTIDYENILNGQNVKERISRSYEAISTYKKLGFCIPNYFKQQFSYNKNNISQQIINFLKMEENSVDENIKIIKKQIRTKNYKFKIKQFIKEILFVNKWRK